MNIYESSTTSVALNQKETYHLLGAYFNILVLCTCRTFTLNSALCQIPFECTRVEIRTLRGLWTLKQISRNPFSQVAFFPFYLEEEG